MPQLLINRGEFLLSPKGARKRHVSQLNHSTHTCQIRKDYCNMKNKPLATVRITKTKIHKNSSINTLHLDFQIYTVLYNLYHHNSKDPETSLFIYCQFVTSVSTRKHFSNASSDCLGSRISLSLQFRKESLTVAVHGWLLLTTSLQINSCYTEQSVSTVSPGPTCHFACNHKAMSLKV